MENNFFSNKRIQNRMKNQYFGKNAERNFVFVKKIHFYWDYKLLSSVVFIFLAQSVAIIRPAAIIIISFKTSLPAPDKYGKP